ncbi:hypothetical protein VTJ83DRAFT_7114 [Remersonia thermophila]|uniref:Endosomal peripheral membrane protein n=1 Tax=Remersonia thermophila TaxID=72144 RepID=A0ABR4D3M1_9PEZI
MTSQLLASELANLIQESKRKHNDLRQAAEKSLEELKSLRASSEAQTSEELSQRPNFVKPFIIACGTKNVKFTGIAIVCLQRLIVARALPRSRLSQVLEALQQATSAGLDVQLKILQALPALLSNYATDVKGELLVTALNVCFVLQSSKNAIVNNTSAATLQQLVVSVFDKVVAEDKSGADVPAVGEVPVHNGSVPLRSAAMDAYRVFHDICLLTQGRRPEYLRVTALPTTFGLELIESVLTNHAAIFPAHPEQADILRARVMPFIISALGGKPNFATSVRLVRILYTLLRRHLAILPQESGDALEILTQLLDQDTTLWKRALCMEVFRGIFADHALLRRIFVLYDAQKRSILKELTATFVRVSTEKPSVIGLGHQSTLPVAGSAMGTSDQMMLEASGVTGIISSSGSDSNNVGISTQWSTMRVPCIDQLDKTDAPAIPESYVYSLTLSCITSLSEGLAKFILPLTVPSDGRKKRAKQPDGGRGSPAPQPDDVPDKLERSPSFKRNPVPVNPLTLQGHPLYDEIRVCAAFIEDCWPAILATCSTFLSAALDSEYYHGLVRSFQKFAHVAGLLQLSIPRDAFLTTLAKAAVPPNVVTACLNAGSARPPPSPSTAEGSGSLLSNARGLLSVDNLVSPTLERQRQHSLDVASTTLNTRNLLCLRALLNLGIALGPTLSSSWSIVLECLQQADFVMFSSGKAAGRTPLASSKGHDPIAEQEASTLLANFSTEVRAVETAASRLFESTVDFPNPAFVEIVEAVCDLLDHAEPPPSEAASRSHSPPPPTSGARPPAPGHRRVPSISVQGGTGPNQENQFALSKIGDLASINIERLLAYPPDVSGWAPLMSELAKALGSVANTAPVRTRAADTLVRILLEEAGAIATQPEDVRALIQRRLLEAFRDSLAPLQAPGRDVSIAKHAVDVEIHRILLEGLRSLLENCGESLVSGWELTFEIIGSIFIEKTPASDAPAAADGGGAQRRPAFPTRAVKLIRPSFSSLQLICSDFLPSLPNACFLNLVDTLYKFCTQDDELNVALTTVTFFWAISDFLSSKGQSMSITEAMVGGGGEQSLVRLASEPFDKGSGAALWMLLLLRLTSVASDQRLELRNSAIQTLMRIMSAYGDRLSPEAWSVCMRAVIFSLLSSVQAELRAIESHAAREKEREEWKDTAGVVIQGLSDLFSSYLHVLTTHRSFPDIWRDLITHFGTLLELDLLDVNASAFSALRDILHRCADERDRPAVGTESLDLAWDLWSRAVPVPGEGTPDSSADNHKCLLVWVEALLELYGLIYSDLGVERVQRMLTLLRDAMQRATPGTYASDVEYVTPLQGKILEVFRLVRTDKEGVPSAVTTQAAEFVSLPFVQGDAAQAAPHKRTYVAMSKESMSILESLIVKHASDRDIYETGAFATALSALAKPIGLKYAFTIVTKSLPPWKAATTSALATLEAALPRLLAMRLPRPTAQTIWDIIVSVARGIIQADLSAPAASSADLLADQRFDIQSFHKLRALIIPALGGKEVREDTREAYASALFRTSIIHAPAPAEEALIFGRPTGSVELAEMYKKRMGRTVDPEPTRRRGVAEVCLDELFALVEARGGDDDDGRPNNAKDGDDNDNDDGDGDGDGDGSSSRRDYDSHVRLARTVAPHLLLRCALTLRSYVADQPLRLRMPQPKSQRRELLRIVAKLAALRSEPGAVKEVARVDCAGRKHLLRLYPLLVEAVGVAARSGDEEVGRLLGAALEVVGGEFGL